jgi:RHS repeat-associated protein
MPLAQTINVKNQFTANGYTYDAAGNVLADGSGITSCGGTAYTWNAEEQMSCAAGATYLYDGDGIRVGKSGGAASPTLYWGAGTLVESDTSGNVTSEYIFLGGKRIARRDLPSGNVYYYFADALGSSNVVATAAGAIENESDFYPFGGESPVTDGLTNQHYKFEGKERDANTASTSQPQGLDYFGARFDSSATGRFMSPDWANKPEPVPYSKLGNPQTLNLYAFALNNPESSPDLDGHEDAAATADAAFTASNTEGSGGQSTPPPTTTTPQVQTPPPSSNNSQAKQQPVYCASKVQAAIKSAYMEAVRDNGLSHSAGTQSEKGFSANATDGTVGKIVSGDNNGQLSIPAPPGTTDTFHTHSSGDGMPSTTSNNVAGSKDKGDTAGANRPYVTKQVNVYVISSHGLAIAPAGSPLDGSQSHFVFSGDSFGQWYKAMQQSCSGPTQ